MPVTLALCRPPGQAEHYGTRVRVLGMTREGSALDPYGVAVRICLSRLPTFHRPQHLPVKQRRPATRRDLKSRPCADHHPLLTATRRSAAPEDRPRDPLLGPSLPSAADAGALSCLPSGASMLTDREEDALLRVRVLRASSYRCHRCGALASRVSASGVRGEGVALCLAHADPTPARR